MATMNTYAVEYSYVDDPAALAAKRPEHRGFLKQQFDAGILLASGPFLDETPGALLLLRTVDQPALAEILASDPFAQAELIAGTTIREWNPVFGPWNP